MSNDLPVYLKQGEVARLFPVLSTTSKEGRTTSIVLACMSKVDEFGSRLLSSIGWRVGKTSNLDTYTEIVCEKHSTNIKDRPDGLLVLRTGKNEKRALVEAKIGNSVLEPDQIERYRAVAKENNLDCVITISNQFATVPSAHPLDEVRKSRSKIPVYHWSWMHILTVADLLLAQDEVEDADQRILLNELRRFLTHDSAGIKGFERMPKEWAELNKLVSAGGTIGVKNPVVEPVLEAWHQETRDLSLILSRMTGAHVSEKLSAKYKKDTKARVKSEIDHLCRQAEMISVLDVPDAAASIEVKADIKRRSIDVGMRLRAPEDKKTNRAKLNWLLRQIKVEQTGDYYIRAHWPGKSAPTQVSVEELREDVERLFVGKEQLGCHTFEVFLSVRLGGKFTQQANFISELERILPKFYGELGSQLRSWHPKPPSIKKVDANGERDVSTEGLAIEAEAFEIGGIDN